MDVVVEKKQDMNVLLTMLDEAIDEYEAGLFISEEDLFGELEEIK